VPVVDAIPIGVSAVVGDHFVFSRNTQRRKVRVSQTCVVKGFCMIVLTEVAKVGEAITECRQFPVEHGDYTRLGGMDQCITQPVVAMYDDRRPFLGYVSGQPVHQDIHRYQVLRLRGEVLFRPAADLAFEIVAWSAECLETNRLRPDVVQFRHHPRKVEKNCATLRRCQRGHGCFGEDPTLHKFHDVKLRANH